MAKLTKTEFARRHQITITNIVWSWGGKQSESKGNGIVLFVWKDEIEMINGIRCVQVLDPAFDSRPGYSERLRHLDEAKCQNLPIKLALQKRDKKEADEISRTREIDPDLFEGGEPFQHQGKTWVPLGARLKA